MVVGNTSIPRPAGSTFRVVDEIFPKYSGDEFTSNQPTISETVPLTPPFARRLENKLMTLGTSTQKKADNTSMSKLSVENTMLKEKLKEQKKLVISLHKHKRKLEHQVEAF